MRENADQNNFKYGQFLRSDKSSSILSASKQLKYISCSSFEVLDVLIFAFLEINLFDQNVFTYPTLL